MKTKLLFTLMIILSNQLFAQQGWFYQLNIPANNEYGAICAVNKDTVYVIADNGMFFKTQDGGTNWAEFNTGRVEPFFDLSFINSDTGYAVGQNGTIIRTADGGTSWTLLTSGTSKDLFSISTQVPDNIWAVGDSGVMLNSHDYGNTWLINDTLTDKRLNNIYFKDTNTGYIAGNGGTLLETTNGGINWNQANITTNFDLFSLSITDNYTYLIAGGADYYYYNGDRFYRTNDNINWTSNYFNMEMWGATKFYFPNDSIGFVITSNCTTNGDCKIEIYKTVDYGQNWELSFEDGNTPGMVGIAYCDIEFVTDSIRYTLSGCNVLKTIDCGTLVSIKKLNSNHYFQIYPNPVTSDKLNIELSNIDLNKLSIEIFDINGRLILKRSDLSSSLCIDLPIVKEGVYYMKLLQEGRILGVEKLAKLK